MPFIYSVQQDIIKTTLFILSGINYKWFGVGGNHSITIVICKIQFTYLTQSLGIYLRPRPSFFIHCCVCKHALLHSEYVTDDTTLQKIKSRLERGDKKCPWLCDSILFCTLQRYFTKYIHTPILSEKLLGLYGVEKLERNKTR